MSKIVLEIQAYDGIEEVDFDFYATRISHNQWEVDELDLDAIQTEIAAGGSGDLEHLPEIFIRRLKGAVVQAIEKTTGYRRAKYTDGNLAKQNLPDATKWLGSYGLESIRYTTRPKEGGGWEHATIDLKFQDGQEIICPCPPAIWSAGPHVAAHLNSIEFQGGGWEDGTNWKVFDHLFSHGH